MPWAEVYSALQLKAIDAVEAQHPASFGAKLYEQVKFITKTGHINLITGLVGSRIWFDKLPPDLQKVLRDEALKAGDIASKGTIDSLTRYEAQFREKGVTVAEIDTTPFREVDQGGLRQARLRRSAQAGRGRAGEVARVDPLPASRGEAMRAKRPQHVRSLHQIRGRPRDGLLRRHGDARLRRRADPHRRLSDHLGDRHRADVVRLGLRARRRHRAQAQRPYRDRHPGAHLLARRAAHPRDRLPRDDLGLPRDAGVARHQADAAQSRTAARRCRHQLRLRHVGDPGRRVPDADRRRCGGCGAGCPGQETLSLEGRDGTVL